MYFSMNINDPFFLDSKIIPYKFILNICTQKIRSGRDLVIGLAWDTG